MRSWARTSLRIKNLMKNRIENQEPHQNQDLGQYLIEILIKILNEDFFFIKNRNENDSNGGLRQFNGRKI